MILAGLATLASLLLVAWTAGALMTCVSPTVLGVVLRQGMALTVTGLAAGAIVALAATRCLQACW